MRGKRVTLTGLLQAAAATTAAFSVLTSFSSVHHYIELFSHFRLQYLAVSLLLLLVFAALRSLAYSSILFATLILNAAYVVPWYLGDTLSDASDTTKLVHINVRAGNDQHDRLLDYIKAEQADILFLQEVSPEWLASIRSLNGDYPYRYTQPRHDNFGIALLSRLPLDSVTHVNSPPLDYPTIVATLTLNGELLTLVSTHAMIPLTRSGFEARNEQLQSVAEITKALTGAVILSGDFNTSLWSPTYRVLEDMTGLRNTRRGVGVLPTWPTFMPFSMIPIDHVLVSDAVQVASIRRGKHLGSDHLPLIMEFSLSQ